MSSNEKNAAVALGKEVELRWATATETNNWGFAVQRSAERTTFQPLGFVAGNGTTTSPHFYRFNDRDLSASAYYIVCAKSTPTAAAHFRR